jgi:signal transduction histidine kinase
MARFTLTHKTLIFIVITLAVIITLRVGSARLIILKEFTQLEADLTRQNMARLLAAVDRECQDMARIVGSWSDTPDLVRGVEPEDVAVNLGGDTFTALGLNLILLADTGGGIHWARTYAGDGKRPAPLNPDMGRYLEKTRALWQHPTADSRRAGLLYTPMGLMLVAAGPIASGDGEGPVGGTIIIARRFGMEAIRALENHMRMEIAVLPLKEKAPPPMPSPHEHRHLTHSAIDVHTLDETRLRASAVVSDMSGRPAIELAAVLPRRVFAQGQRTIHYFLFWQAVSAILVTAMVIVFLRRVILIPITRLHRQVSAIADRSSFTDRLEVTTTDEVGEASRAINQMLAALDAANTKLQAAYDELKDTQAQLIQSAKMAAIGELAAGVAHELNQPLMVIRGTTQLLRRGVTPDDPRVEMLPNRLDLIERNTKRMMNIIEHLRAFSSRSSQVPTLTAVNKAIEDCFLLVGEQLRVNAIDVTLDLSPDLPRVLFSPGQLDQVLVSLITNARDAVMEKRAAGEPGMRGRLQVSTALAPGTPAMVEVRIQDNGIGITADRLDWIFDPFFTTKAVGRGTGLGLSISYGIVQEHKGELRVHATGPDGTTFALRLPTGNHREGS